jgi:hypothetical protein
MKRYDTQHIEIRKDLSLSMGLSAVGPRISHIISDILPRFRKKAKVALNRSDLSDKTNSEQSA